VVYGASHRAGQLREPVPRGHLIIPYTTVRASLRSEAYDRKRYGACTDLEKSQVNRIHCYLIMSSAPLEGWGVPRKVLYLRLLGLACPISPVEEEQL